MASLNKENGVYFLVWLAYHKGIKFKLGVPGTNESLSHDMTKYIEHLLKDMVAMKPFALDICSDASCWCSTLSAIDERVVLQVPRLEQLRSFNDTMESFKWASHGLAVLITLVKYPENDFLWLNAVEVHLGPLETISTTSQDAQVCQPTIQPWFLQTFSRESMSLCIYEKNNDYLDKRFLPPLCSLLSILDQLWGPSDLMTSQELLQCTTEALHRNNELKKKLPPSKCIPLSQTCIDWLCKGNVHLSALDDYFSTRNLDPKPSHWSSSYSSSSVTDDQDSVDSEFPDVAELEHLCCEIEKAIFSLGSPVIPKLLWRAPKDAVWISPQQSLQCSTERDVLLILKASSRIYKDLDYSPERILNVIEHPEQPALVDVIRSKATLCLSRTVPILNGFEFRAFFYRERLLGICQRDLEVSYVSLLETPVKVIIQTITQFFNNLIVHSCIPVFRGALDLYFEQHENVKQLEFQCRLLSVCPWGNMTDPLLFNYDELREMALCACGTVDLRLIGPEFPRRANPEIFARFPLDVQNCFTGNCNVQEMIDLMNTRSSS